MSDLKPSLDPYSKHRISYIEFREALVEARLAVRRALEKAKKGAKWNE